MTRVMVLGVLDAMRSQIIKELSRDYVGADALSPLLHQAEREVMKRWDDGEFDCLLGAELRRADYGLPKGNTVLVLRPS